MKRTNNLIICIIVFILAHINVNGQQMYTSQEWYSYGVQSGSINRTVSVVDHNNNVIVVSNKLLSNNTTDVYIKKYNKLGTLLWQKTYNGAGSGNDYGVQVCVNNTNEIFVAAALTGTTSMDFGLLKYNESGVFKWATSWNGASDGMDVPADLVLDGSGNVYLAGGSQTSGLDSDVAVVKFNSVGAFQWHESYDFANLHDAATNVDFAAGVVYVTGASASTINNWDYVTLKIIASTGIIDTATRVPVPGVGFDNALDVTTDDNNNIYITGYVEVNGLKDVQTVKIDDQFGLVWVRNFDGINQLDDVASSIVVDDNGNVYITGYSESPTGNEFLTIKYNSQGVLQWSERYGGLINADDAKAAKIALDDNNGVIIAGTVEKNNIKSFTLLKYSGSGKIKFVETFTSDDGNSEVEALSVKGEHVFVSGNTIIFGIPVLTTVKYTIVEKEINYVLDSLGVPMYEANDLIVRLDTSALKHDVIDKDNYNVGKLESFLKPAAVLQIRAAITNVCGSSKCDVTVYKIFKQLKTTHNTTTSRIGETIKVPNFWATLLFEFPDGVDVTEAATDLEELFPLVKYVDPNVVAIFTEGANDSDYTIQHSMHETTIFPNANINVEEAWNLENGKPFVKVGVLDAGITWEHEDFGDGTSDGSKVIGGWDFGNNIPLKETPSTSNYRHGTKVAGIIGAIRNNNTGIAGIAGGNDPSGTNIDSSGVSLYGLKITSGGLPYGVPYQDTLSVLTYIADAIITSAIDNVNLDYGFGLHIMNASWGFHDGFEQYYIDTNLTSLTDACHFVNRANVTFVTSSGNSGGAQPESHNNPVPASIDDDWILCVSGTGFNGDYKYFWNGTFPQTPSRGWHLDVAAPAADALVWTTDSDDSDDYDSFAGTSAAAPHVSGVASLLMSYLNESSSEFDNLAPEDVEFILQMTATDANGLDSIGNPSIYHGVDSLIGYGRVNAGLALESVNKDIYQLSHYNSEESLGSINLSLHASNEAVFLSEHYGNPFDVWFLPDVEYHVNVYKAEATVYHFLPELDSVFAYWPRHSASYGFPLFDINNILIPRERIEINNLDLTSAVMTSYFYEVSDSADNYISWWPYDPFIIDPDFDYTILHYNSTLVSVNEIGLEASVTVYPTPTNNEQKISINLENNVDLKVDLYDLRGRIILNVFNGNISSGITEINVSVKGIKPGVYIYRIISKDKTKQIKTIIN